MPEMQITFSVYCSQCGAGICNETDVEYDRYGNIIVNVDCPKCRESSYNEGFNDGYQKGLEAGKE